MGSVVTGILSDYELDATPSGFVIKKFRGFDRTELLVPNVIDDKKSLESVGWPI